MMQNSREISKARWHVGKDFDTPSLNGINTGSFQRIADACELMAKNHAALIAERDRYKRLYDEERALVNKRDKQIAAYKGIIGRLKCQAGGAQ